MSQHTHWNTILPFVKNETVTWMIQRMELDVIMLSEVSKGMKDKDQMVSLICGI